MFGRYYNHGEVDAASGPIASACSAGLLEGGSDGYGMLRTTYGLRYTRNSKRDGYMSMRARKRGTSQGYMPKVSIPSTKSFF